MRICAHVNNQEGRHDIKLTTNDQFHSVTIPPKATGFGSSVNGGELLLLALATCYCNDVYREAEKLGISVQSVDVSVEADFGGPGEPARNVTYRTRVTARAAEVAIRSLIQHTDQVAEIHNTLRSATQVKLSLIEAVSV